MSNSTDDLPANPYPPSAERLEDKPGYPFNTARGAGNVMSNDKEPPRPLDTGRALSDGNQLGTMQRPFMPETGQNSARRMIDRLAPDEPIFCLIGRDISGAMFVRSWIALQELNPDPPWAKIRRARQILAQFEQYHRDGKTKWPD